MDQRALGAGLCLKILLDVILFLDVFELGLVMLRHHHLRSKGRVEIIRLGHRFVTSFSFR
jgi:hypothetical protein